MKFNPRLKILATKPTTSPVIPPPKPINKSDLLKLLIKSLFKKKFIVLKFFDFSLELNEKKIR